VAGIYISGTTQKFAVAAIMNETKDLGAQLCYLPFDTLRSLDGKYFTQQISCSLLTSSFSASFSS
jgi:hypothetical protein